jgi:hypothetical protein
MSTEPIRSPVVIDINANAEISPQPQNGTWLACGVKTVCILTGAILGWLVAGYASNSFNSTSDAQSLGCSNVGAVAGVIVGIYANRILARDDVVSQAPSTS